MSKWIIQLSAGPAAVVELSPVMLANGALATESRIYAPSAWQRVMKEDGSAFTTDDVRALQGQPRLAAPWVDAEPPDMVHEQPAAPSGGLGEYPPVMANTPDLDPPA